jgi:parallel beta-helix repeat protein
VRVLRSGQTGCLRSGTYRQLETDVKRPHVTLQSAPGERAAWRGRVVLQGRGDRLIGLRLDGSAGPHCSARNCGALPSPTINAPDVVVAYNDITSPDSGICVHPRAWRGEKPDRFLILRNRIHDCGRFPPTEHDHGIYVADGTAGVISGNVVFRNADRGIQLYPEARGTLVVHNTVDGNGSGIIFSERSSYNSVRNNVFTNSVVRWNAETYNLSGSGNRFADNCVRAGNPNPSYNEHAGVALTRAVAQRSNRAARGSVYVDRAAGDLRVRPRSVCAGKGAPDSVAAPRAH